MMRGGGGDGELHRATQTPNYEGKLNRQTPQPPYPEAKVFPDELDHIGTKINSYVVV